MTSHPIVGFEKLQARYMAVTTSAWLERSSTFLRWFHRFFVWGTRESVFETGKTRGFLAFPELWDVDPSSKVEVPG